MKQSDLPARFQIPFANAAGPAYVRTIPQAHQAASLTDAPASLTDGFPPETFQPLGSGGVPPNGADMNGILRQITLWARWQAAGGPLTFNAAFSAAIGGYPKGAELASSSFPGASWISTADDNTTNPDGGSAANWIMNDPVVQYITGVTGGRSYASGFKQCWGRVVVPANSDLGVPASITHTEYIIPTIMADIDDAAGSNNQIGSSPVGISNFLLRNRSSTAKTVNWTSVGR